MRYVHMVMKYKCDKCMSEANMYVEKGLEENCNRALKVGSGMPHKPVPFAIKCPECEKGFMTDYGFRSFPDFLIAPDGLNMFINDPGSDHGVPVFGYREGKEDEAAESDKGTAEGVQEV